MTPDAIPRSPADLQQELAQSLEEVRALSEVSQVISASLDLREVLSSIAGHAVRLSRSDACGIYEFNQDRQAFEVLAAHNVSRKFDEAILSLQVDPREGVIGQAIQGGQPVQVPNVAEVSDFPFRELLLKEGFHALLVTQMTKANPLWGAPRIHAELLKLGINVAERTVSRLMPKRRTPPSQTWRTFLTNHVHDLVSIDFFTVPTAGWRVLFVLVVLAHHRRRVLHFNVTEHPTAGWTAQQIVEAFPDDTAPAYLLRDRDTIYGHAVRRRVKGMRILEVLTAAHGPWQNPFVERVIGSIRHECLDHVLVLHEPHLRRILTRYFAYYHRARTHLSLEKDAPDVRPIERPEMGTVVQLPEVGGLRHRYVRRAA